MQGGHACIHLGAEEIRVGMNPHQEGREGSYDGGVEVFIVARLTFHGLRLNVVTHQLYRLSAVCMVYIL